jgi:Type II secretion system (T2SS), protein M
MSLTERYQQLEPRERQLLGIFVSVLAVLLLLALPAAVAAILSSKRDETAALREALDLIQAGRQEVIAHDRERQQVLKRYANPAPPLASLLEQAASAYKIEIPESQDQAPVPHGKRYEERSTKLSLHKIGMLNLVSFLEKIEQSGHPVAITKIDIRKRGTEQDSYDVDMIVSAFDRKAEEKNKKKSDTEGEGTQ